MRLEVAEQLHLCLRPYIQVVSGLAAILGDDCEILLYDVSMLEHSIIACVNGHITGREIGSPMTGYGLQLLNAADQYPDGVHIYMARANNGVLFKCGVIFLRDERGKVIGLLCLHIDTTKAQAAKKFVDQFFAIKTVEEGNHEPINEFYGLEIEDVFKNTLHEVKIASEKPLYALSKREKKEVVSNLLGKGFFMMKGSVDFLAREMQNSKFTIYAYMREVQSIRDGKKLKR